MATSLLNSRQIEAIEKGTHDNPFAVLGLHIQTKGKRSEAVIRTFQPQARQVTLYYDNGKALATMSGVSESGLFETVIPGRDDRFDYYFEIQPWHGDPYTVIDPYSFGPMLGDDDLNLWGEGAHCYAYRFMGAHPRSCDGVSGTHFVVCAPAARRVSVVGPFNNWDGRCHVMRKHHEPGIWELFIPGIWEGELYKYEIKTDHFDLPFLKSDPYGFRFEVRPDTAGIVHGLDHYKWGDQEWMSSRSKGYDRPISIYEVHAGSWRRKSGYADGEGAFLGYRELAGELIPYVQSLGYTHVELMPLAEHPYDPSWGYQITGFYAATSRYGSPEDLKYFVDQCHRNGIGVIMDWVPAHFAKDEQGLRLFDGTHFYEHADPRLGEHRGWGTHIFNFGRREVVNFLVSNAVFWFEQYHIDGLRVDAVASMLYLDYEREEGEWIPNKYGGNENLEAIQFIKRFNETVNREFDGVMTIAEESTSWPMVSQPTYIGGLGFDYKWNMGWMNDTLKYFQVEPLFRRHHHNQLTFSIMYAFSEKFVLPLSHDEVVHLKRSLLSKMPGDEWQQFANLRLLYTYMYAHPGKNLLFMGGEFGQWQEWDDGTALQWHLLERPLHQGVQILVGDLNRLYRSHPALHEVEFEEKGFEWVDFTDSENSILAFMRHDRQHSRSLLCVFNFTPQVHHNYSFGVNRAGPWRVLMNSDSHYYGGSNVENHQPVAVEGEWHGCPAHLPLNLPPLTGMICEFEG